MIKQILFIACIVIISSTLWGIPDIQNKVSPFSLFLLPGVRIPMGTYSSIFNPGGGVTLDLSYDMNSFPIVISCSTTYDIIPLDDDLNVSLFSFGFKGGFSFYDNPFIEIAPYVGIGYFYSFLQNNSEYGGGHPYGTAGVKIEYHLSDMFGVGINTGYRHFFGFSDDFSLSLFFRTRIFVPNGQKNDLNSSILNCNDIYPVLLNYYKENPVCSVLMDNVNDKPITILKVSFFVPEYMKEPGDIILNTIIPGKESLTIDVSALFLPTIFTITSPSTTQGIITLDYIFAGKIINRKYTKAITFQPWNMLPKENPEQISAFITYNDPDIYSFTELFNEFITEYTDPNIGTNIFIALNAYNAMREYGIELIDKTFTENDNLVIQIPGSTLKEKKGSSIDIAVFLCSLFESLDIQTALIYTPDTTFTAFSLDIDPVLLKDNYTNIDNLIIAYNKVWIPLSFTTKSKNFYEAVEDGYILWKTNLKQNKAILFPVHELQKTYNGLDMSLIDFDTVIESPQKIALRELNRKDLDQYYRQQSILQPIVVKKNDGKNNHEIRLMNNRALIYAKYKLYDKAIVILHNILLQQDYIPALINLGNIYFLLNEMKKASAFYERAYEKDSIDPIILLSFARVNYALENYGDVKENYRKLVSIDPVLAMEFQYLEILTEMNWYPVENPRRDQKVIWVEK